MKKTVHHMILSTCFAWCFIQPTFAVAPVVDESENFALFDEQLAAAEQPAPLIQANLQAEDANLWDTEDNAQDDNDGDGNLNTTHDHVALAHEDASNNQPQDASNLFNKIQSMQQELSELRGQLEVQTHALQTLKQQQLEFYKDLDTRLRDNTNTAANTTSAPSPEYTNNTKNTLDTLPTNTAPRGNPADEQVNYLAAYELVKDKEFDKALMAMKSFIQHYPRGGYTANAHYWLGELYMIKKSFPDAIQQFETVLNSFPTSSKASASSLKLGYALEASGQKDAARQCLKTVIRDYPDTHAAQLATSKLETLSS
ncbi:MAG: tol-pal system protein YbgF [Gammaproteobacteria bacterium]|nr:tol-pal system protein YbgF [Gammaproteobacteria bacterium]MCH9763696.1 tol-pal system protein YbgF [Gammaproteobacteria bacterium]